MEHIAGQQLIAFKETLPITSWLINKIVAMRQPALASIELMSLI